MENSKPSFLTNDKIIPVKLNSFILKIQPSSSVINKFAVDVGKF